MRTPQEQTEIKNRTRKMVTKVYRLNYVRSIDFLQMIEPFLTPQARQQGRVKAVATPVSQVGINAGNTVTGAGTAPGTGGAVASMGSGSGGGAAGGSGTASGGITGGNSLSGGDVVVIQDYETVLRTVDEIYKRLDIQPIQVLIEAVILSVELDRTKQLGVNFAFVDKLGSALGEVGNSNEIANTVGFRPLGLLAAPGIIGGPFAGPPAMVNGVAGTGTSGLIAPTNGIKFGFVSKDVAGFIRALETIAETNVLASPRILVLNKQRAEIQLGQRLGYATLSQNFVSTIQQVQFLNTGTLLRLRPFVSSDGMVRMEVHPERSSGAIINNLPQSNLSEVTTNVMVPSGATLVIGGLIENEDDFEYQGPLGLSRIPGLSIFGNRQRTHIKRELIVLLTPHIWDPNTVACPPPEFVAGSSPAPAGPALAAPPAAAATTTAAATGRSARGTRLRWPLFGRPSRPASPPPAAAPSPATMTPTAAATAPADGRLSARAKVDDQVALAGFEVRRGRSAATEEVLHIVRPGETLRMIARDRLGDARRAAEVLELNRGSLDPSGRLTPGQSIFLPADARR